MGRIGLVVLRRSDSHVGQQDINYVGQDRSFSLPFGL